MVVISDTSPLTALLLVRREDILRAIFDRVLIPPAVERELRVGGASWGRAPVTPEICGNE